MFKKERQNCYKALILCVVAFFGGELMLNKIAPMEHPPMGSTFHIIVGCALMTLSLLSVFLLIKHLIHLNKKEKKRRRNHVPFLNEKDLKKHH